MKYVVVGQVYYSIEIEASSEEEAVKKAHKIKVGDEPWERDDWVICEPEEVYPAED